MNRLAHMIGNLGYEDLRSIEKDLNEGNIEKLIKERLLYFEKDRKICPVCYKTIDEDDDHFTLMFGPADFRKKAKFCGIDCLEFFINKIKNIRG